MNEPITISDEAREAAISEYGAERSRSIFKNSTAEPRGHFVQLYRNAEVEKATRELRRECDSLRAQLAECKKDKERLDWLEKKTPLAIWAGSFSDSDYNISLGRVGAPICTISTMDDDGHEVDEEIAGGDSLRTAIDSAIAATKENKQ